MRYEITIIQRQLENIELENERHNEQIKVYTKQIEDMIKKIEKEAKSTIQAELDDMPF